MILRLSFKDLDTNFNIEEFIIKYLIPKMYNYLKLNLTKNKLNIINNYIEDLLNEYDIDIIELTLNNLVIEKANNFEYNIKVNPNIIIPNTDYKLETIVKIIEYGNLEIRGLHIFEEAFNTIKEDLEDSVETYKLLLGG